MGYSSWGGKESDLTEHARTHTHTHNLLETTLSAKMKTIQFGQQTMDH